MATKYKRGHSWYLQFYDEKGIQRRPSLGQITKAEAEAHRIAKERQLGGVRSAAGPLFADWVEEYCRWHSQEFPASYFRTEQIIRMYLAPLFGATPIGIIQIEGVEAFKHARIGEAAASTVAKEIRTLKAILNKAVEWNRIPRNPIAFVKPPKDTTAKPPHWYTSDEMNLICAVTPYSPYFSLLANTGLRRGELFQVDRKRDIGREELRVVSEPGARTKSAKWRVIPLSDRAKCAIDEIPPGHGLAPPVTPYSLSRAFSRAVGEVGLAGSLHCLRHTYCSHLVMQGHHLAVVKELAGHSTIRVTERYAHLGPDLVRAAVVNV